MTTDVNFGVAETTYDGMPVLMVFGELDVSTAPDLRARLLSLCDQGCTTVVVDMSDVSFVDSTALGVLVSGLKRLQGVGGNLRLVITQPHVLKVFEITGLNDVFAIYADLATASSTT